MFDWINQNQGIVAILIFLATVLIAWGTGIFRFIRSKPKIKIRKYSNTFDFFIDQELPLTQEKQDGQAVKRVILILGLSLSNVGYSTTTIQNYILEYKDIEGKKHQIYPISMPEPFKWNFKKLSGLQKDKIFPSLRTSYIEYGMKAESKLAVGDSIHGILYFNTEFFGNYEPKKDKKGNLMIKIIIDDSYNRKYKKSILLQKRNIDYIEQFISINELPNINGYKED